MVLEVSLLFISSKMDYLLIPQYSVYSIRLHRILRRVEKYGVVFLKATFWPFSTDN